MKKRIILLLMLSSGLFAQAYWKGEELITGTNSNMSGANSWAQGVGALSFNINTMVADKMFCNFTSGNQSINLANVFVTKKKYYISLKVRLSSGTATPLQVGSNFATSPLITECFNITANSAEATYTYVITASSTSMNIGIINANNNGSDYEIDDVKVQEVLLSSPIARAKTNFVTPIQTSLVNEPNCVFAYVGNQPINKTIVDISGNGNNGSLVNTVYAGGLDGGLQFNGTSSYVTIPYAGDYVNTTFSFRLTPQEFADKYFLRAIESHAGYLQGYVSSGGVLTIEYKGSTSGGSSIATSALVLNQTYSIDVTFGATDVALYLNGVLVASKAHTITGLSSYTSLSVGRYDASSYCKMVLYSAKLYNVALSTQQVKDKWNKIANRPYYINDMSDLTTANYQRDFTKISGTFTIVASTPRYLNCTSTGNLYFTTRDNASSCYMTYDYYTGGAWTSKAGLVSALSTAEATLDYSATTRKLTFIMATNDRVRNIKIIRGAIVQ
jgi:hypothetical protein